MSAQRTKPCQLHTLAAGPIAHIQQCPDCGALSIHVGAISVRMDPDAAESLWATLGEALSPLAAKRSASAPVRGAA